MKKLLPILAGAALVALVLGLAWRSQRTLERGLPPRVLCANEAAAREQAVAWIVEHGGGLSSVLGTGSMAPYIPAAQPAEDPLKTTVAWVVTDAKATFADITQGALCIYRADWSPEYSVIHGAAQKDGDGWIMSGLHNERSEAHWRVTERNFIGLVARVFVWSEQ